MPDVDLMANDEFLVAVNAERKRLTKTIDYMEKNILPKPTKLPGDQELLNLMRQQSERLQNLSDLYGQELRMRTSGLTTSFTVP